MEEELKKLAPFQKQKKILFAFDESKREPFFSFSKL